MGEKARVSRPRFPRVFGFRHDMVDVCIFGTPVTLTSCTVRHGPFLCMMWSRTKYTHTAVLT